MQEQGDQMSCEKFGTAAIGKTPFGKRRLVKWRSLVKNVLW
jgi:hypothetical protein